MSTYEESLRVMEAVVGWRALVAAALLSLVLGVASLAVYLRQRWPRTRRLRL